MDIASVISFFWLRPCDINFKKSINYQSFLQVKLHKFLVKVARYYINLLTIRWHSTNIPLKSIDIDIPLKSRHIFNFSKVEKGNYLPYNQRSVSHGMFQYFKSQFFPVTPFFAPSLVCEDKKLWHLHNANLSSDQLSLTDQSSGCRCHKTGSKQIEWKFT